MAHQLADVLRDCIQTLTDAGVDTPRLDARLLLAHAAGLEANQLVVARDITISDSCLETVLSYISRRARGEPVSRVLGEREFWSLPFAISRDTLDPRPDTETLVEVSLDQLSKIDNAPVSIIDLGTGTGCVLVALLSELPDAYGFGLDVSEAAIQVARQNARRLNLADRISFVVGDWLACLSGPFDLIVANPPYIATSEAGDLPVEVANHDPELALFGGPDGLEAYRAFVPDCAQVLRQKGILVTEIGQGQTADVEEILRKAGFEAIRVHKDLGGIERCLSAAKA